MKRRLYSILWYCCWGLATELVAAVMVAVAFVGGSLRAPFKLIGMLVGLFGFFMCMIALVLGPLWAICSGLSNPMSECEYVSAGRRKRIAVMMIGAFTLLISATWWIPSYLAYREREANDSWRDWGTRQYRTQSVKCPCAMAYIKEPDGMSARGPKSGIWTSLDETEGEAEDDRRTDSAGSAG